MGIFTGVIGAWLLRRGMELGGIIGTAVAWYVSRPPIEQEAINRILSGGWQEVPAGVYATIGLYIWSQIWSFRSTVKDQVVANGKKADLKDVADALPTAVTKSVIEQKVETIAKKRPTLWERLTGKKG